MRSEQQLTRLLRLVPYLAAHQGIEVAAVAKAFGVGEQQVIRDLEVLQFCGLPGGLYDDLFDVDIDAVREEGRVEFRNAEVLSRPLRLRPAEAASLLAALRLVVDVAGESEAAGSALAKLQAVVGDAAERLKVAIAPSDPGHRAALAAAIHARHVVELGYRRADRGGESVAVVEPVAMRLVDGYTYLDAWSRPRGAWRSYRLDRIASVETLAETFSPRADPPSGWFEDAPGRLTLTVRPEARWIAEYYPTTEVSESGGLVRVSFPVASRQWAAALLLRLGDQVVEVSDEGIRDLARARAAEALAGYGEPVG